MLGDYLCEFVAIVRHGAIAPAALELGFSQSALSRHLSTLESTLGCRLLDRTPGGIRLTDDGRYVYDVALEIVRVGENLKERLASRSYAPKAQRVAFAGVTDAPCVLAAVDRAREVLASQGVRVDCAYLPPAAPKSAERALWDGEADLVVAPGFLDAAAQGPAARVDHIELGSFPLVLVSEKTHPLCRKNAVSLDDVRGSVFGRAATRDHNLDAIWEAFVRVCEGRGFTPVCQTATNGAVPGFDALRPGTLLVCVAGDSYSEHLRSQGFAVLPLIDLRVPCVATIRSDDDPVARLARAVRETWA